MSLKEKSTQAVSWSILDKVFKRVIQFILSIFLARLLTPADFGVIAMSLIFTNWAEVFRDFGLGQAIIQQQNISSRQYSTIFYINVAMGLLIGLIFIGISPLASTFYNNKMVGWVVACSSVSFFINGLNVVQGALLNKQLNFKVSTMASFYASLLSGITGIVLAYFGFGVWSLIGQGIMSNVIVTLYIWSHTSWRPSLEYSFKETKPMLKKGMGFMGQGFTNAIFSSLDSMVIGKFYNASTLGLFNKGKSLADMPRDSILLPITRPFFSIFAQSQTDIKKTGSIYLKLNNVLNWGLLFVATLMFVNAKELILLLYGAQWMDSVFYFKMCLLISMFYISTPISVSVWKAFGAMKALNLLTLTERVLSFLALIIGLAHGLDLYLGLLFCPYLIILIMKIYFDRILRLPVKSMLQQYFFNLSVVGCCCCVMLISCSSLLLSFIIKGIVCFCLYIVLSWVFRLNGQLLFWNEFKIRFSKIVTKK